MADGHSHIGLLGAWVKHNWHWLFASATGLWYMGKFSVTKIFATQGEMRRCKDKLTRALFEHEQAEFERFDEGQAKMAKMIDRYRDENLEQHESLRHHTDVKYAELSEHVVRVDGKLDHLTTELLRHFSK